MRLIFSHVQSNQTGKVEHHSIGIARATAAAKVNIAGKFE